jgi:hypothetical protein
MSIWPKEHGTWAMLLVPWLTGVGVARRLGIDEILLLVAALAAFLAQTQLLNLARLGRAGRGDAADRARLRTWAAVFTGATALAALPLVVLRERTALLGFGALGLALVLVGMVIVRARRDRALPGQIVAAVALPLTAPATYHVALGVVDRAAVALWLLNALFFLGAVLYVRLKIEALARKAAGWPAAQRLRFAAGTLAIDVGILVAAALALVAGGFRPRALLAFGPTAVHTLVGVARLHRPARLKRVGLLALAHAIVFAALLIGLV